MNTDYHSTQRKEVTALDDDVPLVHRPLIRFYVSELRTTQNSPIRPCARHVPLLNAV